MPWSSDEMEPECHAMLVHWQTAAQRRGAIPRREDFDPLDLPTRALPWLSIYEHHREAERDRFKCRLAGTGMTERMGLEPSGRYLDEMMKPELYPARAAFFQAVIQTAQPVYYQATLAAPDRDFIAFSRILLPVHSNDEAPAPDLVLGVMLFLGPGKISPEAYCNAIKNNGVISAYSLVGDTWVEMPNLSEIIAEFC